MDLPHLSLESKTDDVDLPDNLKIAVFGCWNTGCNENSGQRNVADKLRENQDNYNFLVILGDNYYPKKYKNKDFKINYKLTNMEEAEKGFKCLDNINIEKKIIMGNHDIENHIDKDCSVLKSILKLPWYDVKFPFSHDLYYIKNVTYPNGVEIILMFYLDTTLYDEDLKCNTCYDRVLGKSRQELKEAQNMYIQAILAQHIHRNIRQVIFYGHEPLFAMKSCSKKDKKAKKDKKDKNSSQSTKNSKDSLETAMSANEKDKKDKKDDNYKPSIVLELLDLLFHLKNTYLHLKFTWICADFHVYQNTKIIINDDTNNIYIDQLIFGTGGGDLDPVSENQNNEELHVLSYPCNSGDHTEKYKLLIYPNNSAPQDNSTFGISKFGYGEITISPFSHRGVEAIRQPPIDEATSLPPNDEVTSHLYPDNVAHTFIICTESSSEKKKYLKYKQKYLELKKKMKKY